MVAPPVRRPCCCLRLSPRTARADTKLWQSSGGVHVLVHRTDFLHDSKYKLCSCGGAHTAISSTEACPASSISSTACRSSNEPATVLRSVNDIQQISFSFLSYEENDFDRYLLRPTCYRAYSRGGSQVKCCISRKQLIKEKRISRKKIKRKT